MSPPSVQYVVPCVSVVYCAVNKTLSSRLRVKCNGLTETLDRDRLLTQSVRSSASDRGPMTGMLLTRWGSKCQLFGNKMSASSHVRPRGGCLARVYKAHS